MVFDPASTFAGNQLTPQQVFSSAYNAGFTTEDQLLAITCIAIAESSLWTQARNWHTEYGYRPLTDVIGVQGPATAWINQHTQQLNSDRGLWQISSHSWPGYTDAVCDVPADAAAAAWTISTNGTVFTPWDTYVSGAAQAHYDAAVGGWPAIRPLVQAFLAPPPAQYFTTGSTWNTTIPGGATFTDNAALHGTGWIETHTYGVPVVHASTSDPLTTITFPASWGWAETSVIVHCPSSMTGATGTDGAIAIIEPSARNGYAALEEYDFWQFHRTSSTTATAQSYAHTNTVTGDGWGQLSPFKGAGIHAAGSSLLAGLIIGNELTTSINHTLAVSFRGDLVQGYPNFIAPAISADGSGGPLKEGMRVGIPPATAMPGGLTTQERNLWIAMQTYGGYIIDVNGGSQAIQFWGDGLSVPDSDVNGLINPSTFATPGMTAISTAIRIVT